MNLAGKKVLLTGGAGFIGSHLADSLLEQGVMVTVLDSFDDFYSGKENNVKENLEKDEYSLIRGSILDLKVLKSLVQECDFVVHLAAQAGIKYCNENSKKAHEINLIGTLNVLQSMRDTGKNRLIYASSSSIFGPLIRERIDENHPTNPSSPYGATKLAAEKYCMSFGNVYGLSVTSLRYFSVYGPRGRPDQIIAAASSEIARGRGPVIYGDGNQERDFTFISDVVDATMLAIKNNDSVGRVFNIGYGEATGINELISKIISLTKFAGLPTYEPTYRGDFLKTKVDNSLARKILRWDPKVNIDAGLGRYLAWRDTILNPVSP